MSNDIHRFVDRLLEHEPGAPHSIQLEIDTDGDPCALFEVLLLIMTDVLKRWYTPPISIGLITQEHAARLAAYYASFSVAFHFDACEAPRVLRINNRAYTEKTRLEDMTFQVAHLDMLYTVRFSNMPIA
jgi:hypothetical protein